MQEQQSQRLGVKTIAYNISQTIVGAEIVNIVALQLNAPNTNSITKLVISPYYNNHIS